MARSLFITTVDNPYSPAEQFDDWYAYDLMMGYNTLGLLGRLDTGGPNQSPVDNRLAREDAINEMVRENVTGMFRKVWLDDEYTNM